jgi:transposase
MHLAMSRNYARAPRGERAAVVEPWETGSTISVISALTLTGVRIPMMIEGAIDGEVLELYVKHCLVPLLQPDDIVLWDQISMHKNPRVEELIEATGAGVELFPAYSPDFDPIEECISKVKAYLRKCHADSVPALRRALKRAFAQVTPEDIHGWFKHCGFVVT